jgi:hypothetical protein
MSSNVCDADGEEDVPDEGHPSPANPRKLLYTIEKI